MSWKCIKKIRAMKLPPTQKFVMWIIADYADDDGIAYPGQKLLARDTCFSQRTVQQAITALVKSGHLARQRRWGNGPNIYLITAMPDGTDETMTRMQTTLDKLCNQH